METTQNDNREDNSQNSVNNSSQELVIFSYSSPFAEKLQMNERIFTIDDKVLRLKQQWEADGRGGKFLVSFFVFINYGSQVQKLVLVHPCMIALLSLLTT